MILLLKMKMAEISSKIAFEKEEKVKVELEKKYREIQEKCQNME